MSTYSAPTLPRFRLSRGQLVLSVILTLLLIALVTTHLRDSAEQRKHTETYARTETATNNMLYTTRETLAYVDTAERYVLGVSPRRNAQLARALLGQRLSVVSDKGVPAGDSLTPEYREALAALDGAIAQLPPGLLDKEQRDAAASVILPKAQALSDAGRRLVDSAAAQLSDQGGRLSGLNGARSSRSRAASPSPFPCRPPICNPQKVLGRRRRRASGWYIAGGVGVLAAGAALVILWRARRKVRATATATAEEIRQDDEAQP